MKYKTTSDRYKTSGLGGKACSTAGWHKSIEWTSGMWRACKQRSACERAVAELLLVHDQRLPKTLNPGREVTTELHSSLFPDTVFLMTGCGTNGPWDPVRKGPVRLHTLIGLPSSF